MEENRQRIREYTFSVHLSIPSDGKWFLDNINMKEHRQKIIVNPCKGGLKWIEWYNLIIIRELSQISNIDFLED